MTKQRETGDKITSGTLLYAFSLCVLVWHELNTQCTSVSQCRKYIIIKITWTHTTSFCVLSNPKNTISWHLSARRRVGTRCVSNKCLFRQTNTHRKLVLEYHKIITKLHNEKVYERYDEQQQKILDKIYTLNAQVNPFSLSPLFFALVNIINLYIIYYEWIQKRCHFTTFKVHILW